MEFKRVQIAIEGDDTDQWYILEHGSMKWAEGEAMPIVQNFDFTTVPLGYAKAIVREPDGKITAEVPEELILRWPVESKHAGEPLVQFGTYATSVKMANLEDNTTDKKRVTECLLKAIGRELIPGIGANPGAEL